MSRRSKDKISSISHSFGEFVANKIFLKTSLSPNVISFLSLGFTLIAAILFALGKWEFNLLAVLAIYIGMLFDYADGIVARAKGLSGRFGVWLDPFLDQLGQQLVFFGICIGLIRGNMESLLIIFICFLGFWSLVVGNIIGLEYNKIFLFDSYTGHSGFSDKFKKLRKKTFFEKIFFNVITPHSFLYFVFFTMRYFLILGIVLNNMLIFISLFALFNSLKSGIMIFLYAQFLLGNKGNRVVKILASLEKK